MAFESGRIRLRADLVARCVVAAFGSMMIHATADAAGEMYDFESLQAFHFIDGQDNWVDQPGQGQATVYLDDTPVNGSKVLRHHPTVGFHESAYVTRVNDVVFGFEPFTGAETSALIQFDCTGDHIATFALGYDRNGDGMLKAADGELGPAFGTDDRRFIIQQANLGASAAVEFPAGNSKDDWYRIQLRVDFTAHGGGGGGSLYYLNITDGETEFQPVPGLQDLDLDLGSMHPDAVPSAWNAMWVHVRSGGSNRPCADHLVPHVEATVPADVNGDGAVDVIDLLAVLAAWGACAGCAEDVNADGVVDVLDLLEVLGAWSVRAAG